MKGPQQHQRSKSATSSSGLIWTGLRDRTFRVLQEDEQQQHVNNNNNHGSCGSRKNQINNSNSNSSKPGTTVVAHVQQQPRSNSDNNNKELTKPTVLDSNMKQISIATASSSTFLLWNQETAGGTMIHGGGQLQQHLSESTTSKSTDSATDVVVHQQQQPPPPNTIVHQIKKLDCLLPPIMILCRKDNDDDDEDGEYENEYNNSCPLYKNNERFFHLEHDNEYEKNKKSRICTRRGSGKGCNSVQKKQQQQQQQQQQEQQQEDTTAGTHKKNRRSHPNWRGTPQQTTGTVGMVGAPKSTTSKISDVPKKTRLQQQQHSSPSSISQQWGWEGVTKPVTILSSEQQQQQQQQQQEQNIDILNETLSTCSESKIVGLSDDEDHDSIKNKGQQQKVVNNNFHDENHNHHMIHDDDNNRNSKKKGVVVVSQKKMTRRKTTTCSTTSTRQTNEHEQQQPIPNMFLSFDRRKSLSTKSSSCTSSSVSNNNNKGKTKNRVKILTTPSSSIIPFGFKNDLLFENNNDVEMMEGGTVTNSTVSSHSLTNNNSREDIHHWRQLQFQQQQQQQHQQQTTNPAIPGHQKEKQQQKQQKRHSIGSSSRHVDMNHSTTQNSSSCCQYSPQQQQQQQQQQSNSNHVDEKDETDRNQEFQMYSNQSKETKQHEPDKQPLFQSTETSTPSYVNAKKNVITQQTTLATTLPTKRITDHVTVNAHENKLDHHSKDFSPFKETFFFEPTDYDDEKKNDSSYTSHIQVDTPSNVDFFPFTADKFCYDSPGPTSRKVVQKIKSVDNIDKVDDEVSTVYDDPPLTIPRTIATVTTSSSFDNQYHYDSHSSLGDDDVDDPDSTVFTYSPNNSSSNQYHHNNSSKNDDMDDDECDGNDWRDVRRKRLDKYQPLDQSGHSKGGCSGVDSGLDNSPVYRNTHPSFKMGNDTKGDDNGTTPLPQPRRRIQHNRQQGQHEEEQISGNDKDSLINKILVPFIDSVYVVNKPHRRQEQQDVNQIPRVIGGITNTRTATRRSSASSSICQSQNLSNSHFFVDPFESSSVVVKDLSPTLEGGEKDVDIRDGNKIVADLLHFEELSQQDLKYSHNNNQTIPASVGRYDRHHQRNVNQRQQQPPKQQLQQQQQLHDQNHRKQKHHPQPHIHCISPVTFQRTYSLPVYPLNEDNVDLDVLDDDDDDVERWMGEYNPQPPVAVSSEPRIDYHNRRRIPTHTTYRTPPSNKLRKLPLEGCPIHDESKREEKNGTPKESHKNENEISIPSPPAIHKFASTQYTSFLFTEEGNHHADTRTTATASNHNNTSSSLVEGGSDICLPRKSDLITASTPLHTAATSGTTTSVTPLRNSVIFASNNKAHHIMKRALIDEDDAFEPNWINSSLPDLPSPTKMVVNGPHSSSGSNKIQGCSGPSPVVVVQHQHQQQQGVIRDRRYSTVATGNGNTRGMELSGTKNPINANHTTSSTTTDSSNKTDQVSPSSSFDSTSSRTSDKGFFWRSHPQQQPQQKK